MMMQRCKTQGKEVTAADILNDDSWNTLVLLDEGFCVFHNIRNSSAYLAKKRKDCFAMF